MKITILSGFLGSGKTTFLMKALAYLTQTKTPATPSGKIAVIENESGDISVDSAAFGDAYRIREIAGGCICCTLTASLSTALQELRTEYDPEYIFIEATGLAIPDKVAELVSMVVRDAEEIRTLVLVDAERWDELREGLDLLLDNQLRCADVIILNKCDMIRAEARRELEIQIREINPHAAFFTSGAKNGDDNLQRFLWG